jgi:S1-C subfamily serine protease
MIGAAGELLGIGSLQLEQGREKGTSGHLNMIVPIDLLNPIFDDLLKYGRPNRPPRPWLGFYAAEADGSIVVIGVSERGPAQRAGLRQGDIVRSINGSEIDNLADMFRRIWAIGPAGADIPIKVEREGRLIDHKVASADRSSLFKVPRLH